MVGYDDLAEVAPRVRLLGVVDVQRHAAGRHDGGEAHAALKLGAAHAHGVLGVGDDLTTGETKSDVGQKRALKSRRRATEERVAVTPGQNLILPRTRCVLLVTKLQTTVLVLRSLPGTGLYVALSTTI
ncbi:hypothetical protein EYF80_038017 [Liparis tanakae]|uniref:Uncharacterized protein n=1 Tax=Liparis tanakae TaxID=230148 RepID=A0A4Z2GEJ1_9TELE|nr:hypothetical protein EYF80_038017 [Liparis tanakae]